MGRLLRRLRYLASQSRLEADLGEEMEFHRAERQSRLERSGLPSPEAADASRRHMGNVTLAREDARGVWVWPSLDHLRQDVRHGVRVLWSQKTFALTAILTLGIGIAATTSIFGVVEAELWRALPYPEPD